MEVVAQSMGYKTHIRNYKVHLHLHVIDFAAFVIWFLLHHHSVHSHAIFKSLAPDVIFLRETKLVIVYLYEFSDEGRGCFSK